MSVRVFCPQIVTGSPHRLISRLKNQTIRGISRFGKKIFLHLDQGVLTIHPRMTGQLLLVNHYPLEDVHVHLAIKFNGVDETFIFRDVRKFGRVEWIPEFKKPLDIPDAWLNSSTDIFQSLRKRRGFIKHALLNQNILAGIGNIYADETLHRSKIHPLRKLERISNQKLHFLVSAIKEILGKSIQIGGTSFRDYVDTEGQRGGYRDWLVVYGKENSICSCGGTIKKIVVVQRGTHYCPRCQK